MKSGSDYPERYWHCSVKTTESSSKKIVNDLTFERLFSGIITPLRTQKPFTVSGKLIKEINTILEIEISHTPHSRDYYVELHKRNNPGDVMTAFISNALPIRSGTDYTNELLFECHSHSTHCSPISNNVFIVHGHDEYAKESVSRLLAKLDLNPVILHEQPNGGKTIIEKFESFSDAAFAVVLLTPDDVGNANINGKTPKPRARQNVVFELGYFIGKIGRNRVCALRKKDVDIPSDISGILYVDMDERGAWRTELAKELKAAGFKIDASKLLD